MDSPTYEAAIKAATSLARECFLSEDSAGNERANLLRELAENGTEPTSFSVKFTIDPGQGATRLTRNYRSGARRSNQSASRQTFYQPHK